MFNLLEQPAEVTDKPGAEALQIKGGEIVFDRVEFGYDPDFTDTVLRPPLRLLYEKWFRVETLGVENIPATGGAPAE